MAMLSEKNLGREIKMKLVNSQGKVILNFNAPLWRFLKNLARFIWGVAVILALFYASCEPI